MLSLLLIISIPAALLGIVWQWKHRQKIYALIDAHNCKLCGEPLDEALFDFLGKPSASDIASLDKFQASYASSKIRCGNCGGYLICADNGMPMNGYYDPST